MPAKPAITRVTRSHAQARASYDRLSRWYDRIAAPSERRFRQVGLDLLAAQPGQRVLEIGSGTGGNLVALARATSPGGQVLGLDLSPGMLAVSRQKLAQAGLLDCVSLLRADALRLPFAAGPFDALFMAFVLELFDTPEIPSVLAESRQALRPGGRLVVVSLLHQSGLMVRLYEWAHQRFENWIDCRPIVAGQSMSAAGFEIVQARRQSMWGLPVEIVLGRKP